MGSLKDGWRRYRERLRERTRADLRDYCQRKGLGTAAGVGAACFTVSFITGGIATGKWLSTTNIVVSLIGIFGGIAVWYLGAWVYYRLRAPFELDQIRAAEVSDATSELARERLTAGRLHAAELAAIKNNHAQQQRHSDKQLAVVTERNKLLEAQHQPRFRFVALQTRAGQEIFDALELWNDGAAVEIRDIDQASYIELRFPADIDLPGANASLAASADARYGVPLSAGGSSIVAERYNRDLLQKLIRHPSNPLSITNNAAYAVSFQDGQDVKYVGLAAGEMFWDSILIPMMARLELLPKNLKPAEPPDDFTASPVSTPALPHLATVPEGRQANASTGIRYIPSYYFHRRHYERGAGTGLLVTLYAWQDGDPGTNYTKEYNRLVEEVYGRWGFAVGVARRTFLTIRFIDGAGRSGSITFDVFPRDPWNSVVATRINEQLHLSMRLDVDLDTISADSLLNYCGVPPAFFTLSCDQPSRSDNSREDNKVE